MTTDGNTRTPQPGDVWETDGKRHIVVDPDMPTGTGVCSVYLDDGTPSHTVSLIYGEAWPNLRPEAGTWTYLGRASDLIAAGLAARENTDD